MRKITPHLWFDTEAKAAAEFYASVFPDAKITHSSVIHGTPTGDTELVSFEIAGQPFMAISAGPVFKINPSISFTISCKSEGEVDALWTKLIDGGKALMELGAYPFSKRYGWLSDKFGVSWQIIVHADGVPAQAVTPSLMYTQAVAGRAEEAMQLYTSVFKNAKIESVFRYKNQPPDKDGTVAHALFTLNGQQFVAMDSAQRHAFTFTEAVSLLIPCETQEEVDYFWEKLAADPQAGQCGWLKDSFGVSWQVWPTAIGEMMEGGTPEQVGRLVQAMMPMKKFNIAALRSAYEGN